MSDKLPQELERLSQTKMLEWLNGEVPANEMVTVYLSDHGGSHNYGIYCALIPSDQIEQVLSGPSRKKVSGRFLTPPEGTPKTKPGNSS